MSELQPKALTPNDFSLLDEITTPFICFERHYQAIAQPFKWNLTRLRSH